MLIIFGFLSGILGGMGMGGGTLLIPLLSFLDLPQQTIQAINLISFLPMALTALFLHCKNGLVKKDNILWIIIPAVFSAIFGAVLTKYVSGNFLKYCFGVLLLGLGVWQMVKSLKLVYENNKVDKIFKLQLKHAKCSKILKIIDD